MSNPEPGEEAFFKNPCRFRRAEHTLHPNPFGAWRKSACAIAHLREFG